jgi:alpha/beta superfamily hydrolase
MVREATTPKEVSSFDEAPAFFEAGGETLFGIHTHPRSEGSDAALILLPSAERLGYHRNRLGASLARRLAEQGRHTFRIDYRGQGESTGKSGRFRIDQPFTIDALGASDWLRDRRIERFIYAGFCFGAMVALAAAVEEPSAAGVILGSMPMFDQAVDRSAGIARAPETTVGGTANASSFPATPPPPKPVTTVGQRLRALSRTLRVLLLSRSGRTWGKKSLHLAHLALRRKAVHRLRDRDYRHYRTEAFRYRLGKMVARSRREVNPQTLGFLEQLVERRVPLLILYGESDGAYAEFLDASKGDLGGILRRAGNLVEIAVVPGRLHGFVSVPAQVAGAELMIDWVCRVDGGRPPRRARLSDPR